MNNYPKILLLFALLISALSVFADEKKPVIVVSTFETNNQQFSKTDLLGLTDLYINELTQSAQSFDVVDRANLDKIMTEVKFQETDWSSSDKVAKLGEALNANWLIRGQILKVGTKSYLSTTLIDVKTSRNMSATKTDFQSIDNIIDSYPKMIKSLISVLNTDSKTLPSEAKNTSSQTDDMNPFVGNWKDADKQLDITFNNDKTITVNSLTCFEKHETHDNNMMFLRCYSGNGTYFVFGDELEIHVQLIKTNSNEVKELIYKGKYKFDDSKSYLKLLNNVIEHTVTYKEKVSVEPDYMYENPDRRSIIRYSIPWQQGWKQIPNPDAGKRTYTPYQENTYFTDIYRQ